MNIAIISDIHDNIPNLTKVLDYCHEKTIEKIICCGDLASIETLDFLNDNFAGEIFFTFGNMDNDYLKDKFCHSELVSESRDSGSESGMTYGNTKIFKNFGEAEFDSNPVKPAGHGARKVAFIHFPQKAKELCETGKYDFVFHGHTHKPWEETIGQCKMLNPGNVANQQYAPTFAVWDTTTDIFKLVRINELQ